MGVSVPPEPLSEPPPGPSADVAVTVSPPAGPYTVGVPGTWRLRVVNNGPSPATNVQLEATPHAAPGPRRWARRSPRPAAGPA